MRIIRLAAVLLAAPLLSMATGCSFVRPWDQTVTIDTTPAHVPVFVDGNSVGPAPVTLSLRRDKSHSIWASTGLTTYSRELNPKLSVCGDLDMVGGSIFLVPGLGLLAPGAYDLDGDTITLKLDNSPPASTQPTLTPVPAPRSDTRRGAIVTANLP